MATELLLPYDRHDAYDFISPYKGLKDAAQGKTVLITGAGTGIGKATARTFAAAGASHLILAARRSAQLEDAKSEVLKGFPKCNVQIVPDTDIAKPESVKKLFASLGGLVPDLLINNAGRGGRMIRIDEGDEDDEIERWWNDSEVNVRGTYLVTRAYLKLLKGRPGRVINTSSNASWKEVGGMSGYALSKAAVNRFSEYVDAENKEKGLRCFALHPGGVRETEMAAATGMPEWLAKSMIDTPDLGAATALYLSTERADFLGGRFVPSTWDMEKLEAIKDRVVKEDLLKTRVLGLTL